MNIQRDMSVKIADDKLPVAFHVLDVLAKPGQYLNHQVILRDANGETWQVPMSCLSVINAPLKTEMLQPGDKVTNQADFVMYVDKPEAVNLSVVKRIERRTGNAIGGEWTILWSDDNLYDNPQEELKR